MADRDNEAHPVAEHERLRKDEAYRSMMSQKGCDAGGGGGTYDPSVAGFIPRPASPNVNLSDFHRRLNHLDARTQEQAQGMSKLAHNIHCLRMLADSLPVRLSPEAAQGLHYLLSLAGL